MKAILTVPAIVLAGTLLHLLFLWMERKGWIYYKHHKPSGSRLGTAFLEIQSILEPNKKHVIEVKNEMKKATEQAGDEPGEDKEEASAEEETGPSRR